MGDQKRIALFPGTFDPITNGHLDVIRRGASLFDELVVGIGDNPDKDASFPLAERVSIVEEVVSDMPNVRVEPYTGLTVDFAREFGAAAILRGIRNSADLQFELQVAVTNREVGGVETVFVMTNPRYVFTSSRLIRQMASMGGDVTALVPPAVMPHIRRIPKDAGQDTALSESD